MRLLNITLVDSKSASTGIEGLPMWAVDPEVWKFLTFNRFKLTIMLDEKYRRCKTDKPLIVITKLEGDDTFNRIFSL
jgi:hypothetical protein